jgi:nucleoside-diphosphate-sugar epimerase
VIAILGAGGAISNELVKLLAARGEAFRLVGRHPKPTAGAAETVAADLTDREQTANAVAGASVVYLLAGLKYDHKVWAADWPRVMANTMEACKRAGAKLVFFDNVYMYGRVNGPMTEETPYNPCSRKGEVRARIARTLEEAWKAGTLTAMIARSADFYGPGATNGIPNVMVFEPLRKGQKAMCLASVAMPHSYTYTPDAARALVELAARETAWNQTWHLPTAADPPTGRQFIGMVAEAMGVEAKVRLLRRPVMKMLGLFVPVMGEVAEMMYQNDSPYLFDSSKFNREFGLAGTPYAESVRATAEAVRSETVH